MPSGLLAIDIQGDGGRAGWCSLFENSAMLMTAIVGKIIYVSNRKAPAKSMRATACA
jgi:hypothetical protein